MKFNLLEDNKNLDNITRYLDSLVVKVRESGKLDDETIEIIKDVYNDINKWMKKYHLMNKEIGKEEEQIMIDKILDLTDILNKLL